jgi:hypothetical protein
MTKLCPVYNENEVACSLRRHCQLYKNFLQYYIKETKSKPNFITPPFTKKKEGVHECKKFIKRDDTED